MDINIVEYTIIKRKLEEALEEIASLR